MSMMNIQQETRRGRARRACRAGIIALATASVLAVACGGSIPHAQAGGGGSTPEVLNAGDNLFSPNGEFKLSMQGDCNLVLYDTSQNNTLWASGTTGQGNCYAIMQEDGNLVIYNDYGSVWASNTDNYVGATLAVQDDGNLVIYDASGSPVWGTNTFRPKIWISQKWGFNSCPTDTACIQVAETYFVVNGDGFSAGGNVWIGFMRADTGARVYRSSTTAGMYTPYPGGSFGFETDLVATCSTNGITVHYYVQAYDWTSKEWSNRVPVDKCY